jgi:hypothetical protein
MIGSFKTGKRVNKHVSLFKRKGFEAFWSQVNLGKKGLWFRVCVGHFETAKAAREFKKDLFLRQARSSGQDIPVRLVILLPKRKLRKDLYHSRKLATRGTLSKIHKTGTGS